MPPSLSLIASLGKATLGGLCVAGVGAVLGLAFVDPAGAAESAPAYVLSQEIEDHGYFAWLIFTFNAACIAYMATMLSSLAWLYSPWWRSHPEVKRIIAEFEERISEPLAADEDYANVTAERQSSEIDYHTMTVTVGSNHATLYRLTGHFAIMLRMTVANDERPYLASLFPSLFGEGLR